MTKQPAVWSSEQGARPPPKQPARRAGNGDLIVHEDGRPMKKIFLLVAGLCVLSIRAPAYSSSSTPPPAAARQSASPPRTSKPGGPPKPDAAAKAVPPGKSPPAPADWDTYTDAERGYRFKVPKGTRTDSRAVAGFDRLIASVPDPQRVAVLVVAFRESRFSKEELLEAAKRTL